MDAEFIVYSKGGKVVNTEGDPDHPIKEGFYVQKSTSLYQLANNPTRLTKPLYRAPYSDKWKEVSWDWALNRIVKLVKKIRDKYFMVKNKKEQLVNRVEAIAHVGSAALDNERLISKIV